MTPALQGMGLSLQDGQGLLNAFEQANVDAGTAAGDLTRAIKNLKPGQNIDDLIAQVGAIEDPILRAKEATKLFGKAAGPEMAAVIKPGMKSLKDVEVQAQNTDGALTDAAAGMETTASKIKGIFEKIGGGARELGQQFGPALSGIGAITSALGPSLITGLQKAWDAVKNSDAVQSAAQSALDISGTITGAAGTIIGNLTGNLIQVVTTSWDKVRDWLLTPGSVTQRAIAAAGAVVGTVYSAAVQLTAAVESKIYSLWIAAGSPGSGVISAAFAAGEAAGGAFAAGIVLAGPAILAAIAKFGTDFLSHLNLPGNINFTTGSGAAPTISIGGRTPVQLGQQAGTTVGNAIGPALADAASTSLADASSTLKDEMASHTFWEPIGQAAAASLTGAMNAGVADHADELAAETAALAKVSGHRIRGRGQGQPELAFVVGDHARQADCRHEGMARAVGQAQHGRSRAT
jgi:hypothetical protein